MKTITFGVEETLLEEALLRARAEGTTLDAEFQSWLWHYARPTSQLHEAQAVIDDLRSYVRTGGRRFDREAMNER